MPTTYYGQQSGVGIALLFARQHGNSGGRYLRHLKPEGVLAIHVTNRLLDLPPVVEAAARAVGARAVKVTNSEDEANAVYESDWMLLDRARAPNGTVSGLAESRISLPPGTSSQMGDKARIVRAWTDDYSNLVEILK